MSKLEGQSTTPVDQIPRPGPVDLPTISVTTVYHRIVCSYPWMFRATALGNEEHGSEHGEWRTVGGRRTYYTLPQNTVAYGRYMANLCRTYGINYISGYWSGDRNSPCIEHFDTSLGALSLQELGSLRLIYMFSLKPNLARIKQAIIDRTNLITGPKYAKLLDSGQQMRVPIMFWGADVNSQGVAFRQFIEELRAHFNSRGVSPFFIITHHALWSNDDNVIRSVDAVYRHECHHNYDAGGNPRPLTTAESVVGTKQNWTENIRQLTGKTQFSTGLPVFYIAGTMPRFWRPADLNRGRVVAQNKAQVKAMFEALRGSAQTLCLRSTAPDALELNKWVAITSLNEWVERSTIEPCLVRPGRTADENATFGYDYGRDSMELIRDIFQTVTRQRPRVSEDGPLSLSGVA